MAEGDGLLNRCRVKSSTQGSNPCLTASSSEFSLGFSCFTVQTRCRCHDGATALEQLNGPVLAMVDARAIQELASRDTPKSACLSVLTLTYPIARIVQRRYDTAVLTHQ